MKRLLFSSFLLLVKFTLYAQEVPIFQWAKQTGTGLGYEYAWDVTTDASGNVLSTGAFTATTDFDPGAGTFELTPNSTTGDIFISKLDANGNFLWAKSVGGGSQDEGHGIVTDAAGNVYVTGFFLGTVDFDPGPSTFNLSNVNVDLFVLKLNANGDFVWAINFDPDYGNSIAYDPTGFVYVAASRPSSSQTAVIKLDTDGTQIWTKTLGSGTGGNSISVDDFGDVVISGWLSGTADFDPGAGVLNLTSSGVDKFIWKLDGGGNLLWAKQLDGGSISLYESGSSLDALGNIYLTDTFSGTLDFDPGAAIFTLTSTGTDLYICKLDKDGNFQWAKRIDASQSAFISTDASGNSYVTGSFTSTVDFDPGSGTFNLTSAGSGDIFILKLDAAGNFVWATRNGSPSSDEGSALHADDSGNVYLTSFFYQTADFDPTCTAFNLTSGGNSDIFIQKLIIGYSPTITSFDPISGNIGTSVTITGTNFSTTPSKNVVKFFNNRTATVTASTVTSLTVTVPTSTTTGKISVTTNCVTAISATDFTIGAALIPTITSFSPASGSVGTTITITGTNFSTIPANNAIQFNGTTATVTASTTTSITTTVPSGATTGKITVIVGGNTATSASDFTIGTILIPTITSFTPTSGAVGTTVAITGTNFSTTPANNIVYFGATKTIVTAATSTQLTVAVPIGATYQPISVLVGTLIAYSREPFVVTFAGGPGISTNSFAPPVNFAAATQPSSLVTGDFDGDGKVDLAVPNIFDNSISVFRNSSSGSGNINYATKIDFAAGNRPESMTVADLDGDGKLDLAVTNENANTVSIFRNTSSGVGVISFGTKIDFPTATRPVSISISDFDKDGKSDLAVVNRNSSSISIFRNTSTGAGNIAFAAKMDFTTGSGAEFVFVADFDGDAKTDLAVANESDFSVSIFRNTSTGIGNINFATKIDFETGPNPVWVTAGDLDGDGKAEMLVSNADDGTVSLYLNTSTGPGTINFATQTFIETETGVVSLTLGDIDGDGKIDLAIANDGLVNSGGQSFTLFRSTSISGNISFAPKVVFTIGFSCDFAALGDFDGDGKTDIAATSSNDEILVYRNALISSPTSNSSNWVRKIGSTGGQRGESIAIDGTGNSYTCGNFGNTVDFDPGSGVFNITAQSLDAFVVKLDENGDFVWAKSMGGTGSDNALSIKLDAIGNIYVAGTFSGTADFDPGAGTFNLTAVGSRDLFITKLNNNGDFVWAKSISGSSFKELNAIALDATGNVYATGYFASTADFDPSVSVVNLTSNGSFDSFLLKLDNDGNFVWVRQIGSTGLDVIEDVTVSLSGNPHIIGYFENTVDFDPGPGNSSFTSLGETDIFITKFDASGNFLWTNHIGSSSFDYGYSLITDATDNVYATGSFSLTADFDPGAGVNNLTAPDGSGFVVKFASNGSFVWANHFEGPFGGTNAYSIGLDDSNNSYVTGDTFDGSDAGQIILTGFDSNGIKTFQDIADGSGSGSSIAVSSSSNIYVTGFFASNVNFTLGDCLGTLNNVSDDAFILKTRANSFAFPTITSFTPTSGSAGTVITITGTNFDIIPSNNIVDFDGVLAIVTASTATTITTLAPVGVGTGKISVTSCGTATSMADFTVTTNPNNQPPVIASSTSAVPINGIITIDLLPLISDPDDNVDLSTLSLNSNISEQGAAASITSAFELVLDYGGVAFAGADRVSLSVCDLLGACDEQELSIEVSSDVIVYNAVSPNNDGLNDIFYIQYINLLPETQENKVNIFNRWGSKVFEVVDYNNDTNVFKGLNQNGAELPSGTYYYKIEFGNGQAAKTGYLVLKR